MWALLIPIAYLIGTVPNAVWLARTRGVDIRTEGSGNPGASNVIRLLGYKWGVTVMVLDMAKGSLAAALGLLAAGRPEAYVLGGAAVIGHVFPVWERFRGGKGVATGGGVFAVLSPFVAAALFTIWFVVSKATGKASAASITIVALLPVGVALRGRDWWEVLASIAICVLIMARHLGNIHRLVTKTEREL